MDTPASPPKRLTRARAAARAATSSTAASAAKSKATAVARAKATSSTKDAAPAPRQSVKRKTRSDDHEDETDVEGPAKRPPPASRTAMRATRGPGRPKKTVEQDPGPGPQPVPRAARGRPPKKAASDPAREEAPARATRTRAKKPQHDEDVDEDVDDLAPEPVKKATRGRPPGTATSTSAPSSKPVKKTVTFEEPDKENVLPVTGARKAVAPKPADASATGMRAKPVRKPAGTGRATRTTATKKLTKNAADKQAQMPLSPRKVTQLSVNRERDADSEDELAMDRTPTRPFQQSPVKPAVGSKHPTKIQEEGARREEETPALPPADSIILLGSPVRRPPQSPFKNSMMSPAKRIDGLQLTRPTAKDTLHSSVSPLKASLLQSPAKRPPMPVKPVDLTSDPREQTVASPLKQSLFQSPAKRLFSPFKPASAPEGPADVRSPAPTPVLLCTPPAVVEAHKVAVAAPGAAFAEADAIDEGRATSLSEPGFNGRMSTLLPRDADPALDQGTPSVDEPAQDDDCETVVLEEEKEQVDFFEQVGEPMALDEPEAQMEDVALGDISTTPPNSPPQETLNLFGLRQNDLLPFDTTYSESEDELTRVMTSNTVSPEKQMRGSTLRPRTSGFGFTPLARRFDEWQARSPQKTPRAGQSAKTKDHASGPRDSMKSTFFEDEMCVRPDGEVNDPVNDTDPLAGVPEIKDPVVEDISITDEDLELVAEANEMSVMSPEQVESMLNLDGNDDTISDASQEYGDENEIPGQAANYSVAVPPVTPQRFIRREFHTVSKVPLKPADESTPPPQPSLRKRRHSISRLPVARPTHTLSRSATVISYSPPKSAHIDDAAFEEAVEESFHERSESVPPPETPSKSEAWSQAGTPARTPRPDVNPTLLRGATVFVDVHTMEGADASAIFVELLTQMGARCLKTWHWNPSDDDASSKIGITHVVYKDGGKRTMEKVRETGGVVQCVGVGWVLEYVASHVLRYLLGWFANVLTLLHSCERENEWLDETPYYIDASLIPRGGARRRKSMEPKALANLNGTLVPNSAARNPARECQTAPTTPAPANRRDSGLWMHSPEDLSNAGNDFDLDELDFDITADNQDWYNTVPLTPVPKTPAPEAIHRFAMDITPDTPLGEEEEDDEENIGVDEMMSRDQLVQQTCPPKAHHMYQDLGAGILGVDRDVNVARRLMDARRKSLAFAPKVSSPLARSSWKDWN